MERIHHNRKTLKISLCLSVILSNKMIYMLKNIKRHYTLAWSLDKVTETLYNLLQPISVWWNFSYFVHLTSLLVKVCVTTAGAVSCFGHIIIILWFCPPNTELFITDSPALQTMTPINHNYKANHRSKWLEWQYPVYASFH